jgi:hypothetical protein
MRGLTACRAREEVKDREAIFPTSSRRNQKAKGEQQCLV